MPTDSRVRTSRRSNSQATPEWPPPRPQAARADSPGPSSCAAALSYPTNQPTCQAISRRSPDPSRRAVATMSEPNRHSETLVAFPADPSPPRTIWPPRSVFSTLSV